MKIGQKQSLSGNNSNLGWFFILACAFGLGIFLGGRNIIAQARDRLSTLLQFAQPAPSAASLPTLTVDMRFENYNELLVQRQDALEDGVYIPAARDFVTATVSLDNSRVPVIMRLFPGPAEHLGEADKWNFDVRTRQSQQLLGMERLYLLDPADNNWLHQWAFARSLKREGILATRYQFVNLIFNGDSRGIYALQEGFGDELMTAHGRTPGIILEFDADLLWESIEYFGNAQTAYADPVANLLATDFRFFEIDTFRDTTIARDEERSAQKDASISRLRALQAGELPASAVFDTEKYGRFLALVDLWGANEAIALTNLRYYYNPETDHLEPVGFNANPFGGQGRIPLSATYNDPVLQAAYAREAQRLSQPAYLTELQAELDAEIQGLQRTLRVQAGDLVLPWAALKQRQGQMRHSLNPVQPVFAYLGPPSMSTSATIQIDVANVINLPLEVLGFDIHGATFLEADPDWLRTDPSSVADLLVVQDEQIILNAADTHVIRYVRFHLPLTEIIRRDSELDFMEPIEIRIATRILGLEDPQLTLAREGAPDLLVR